MLKSKLLQNFHFMDSGFTLHTAFDISPALIGSEIAGVPVRSMDDIESYLKEYPVDVAVLTVPRAVAQATADRLIAAGVRGFWNFTNVELTSSVDNVRFEDVHFADSLLTLSYHITER